MEIKDPFFVVKSEIEKTIDLVNGLFVSWKEVSSDGGDEFQRLSDELRNNLRSIEWDLEDLEETIRVTEKNPGRFKLQPEDLADRKAFVSNTHTFTHRMREKVEKPSKMTKSFKSLPLTNKEKTTKSRNMEYMKLNEFDDEDGGDWRDEDDGNLGRNNGRDINQTLQKQETLIQKQDEQLNDISNSVRGLKQVSALIATELDDHVVLINDIGESMDKTDTRMDAVMKKVTKVLHMTNDRKQWMAIIILIIILFIIIILFVVL